MAYSKLLEFCGHIMPIVKIGQEQFFHRINDPFEMEKENGIA